MDCKPIDKFVCFLSLLIFDEDGKWGTNLGKDLMLFMTFYHALGDKKRKKKKEKRKKREVNLTGSLIN